MSHTLHSLAGATPKTRAEIRALRAARAKAAEEKDAAAKKKGFKEYAPGFIHIDIKYLPRIRVFQRTHQRTSAKIRFASAAELEQTLNDYLLAYNHSIPQQAIGHHSPINALASWYVQHPELFIAPVMIKAHNQAECDSLRLALSWRRRRRGRAAAFPPHGPKAR